MKEEVLTELARTNIAKRFSPRWTYQEKRQIDLTTTCKNNKLNCLGWRESIDHLSNQQHYEISGRIDGMCIVEVAESKLEEKMLPYSNELKLKLRTAIALTLLRFILQEVKLQRLLSEVKL